VEDWSCPSSHPYYLTHHSGDKRPSNISNNHIISAPRGQQSGGQLAARSLGDGGESIAVAVTASTDDDKGSTVVAVPYVVAIMGCLLVMLVIVGVASYVMAARS